MTVSARLVTYHTELPFHEVVSRLEERVNKRTASGVVAEIQRASCREDIVRAVENVTQGNNFLLFAQVDHQRWLNVLNPDGGTPATRVYTIGNPLIAQKLFQSDNRAACFIPIRLLLSENTETKGTDITYYPPSSLLSTTPGSELQTALQDLDAKLEGLILEVIKATDRKSCKL